MKSEMFRKNEDPDLETLTSIIYLFPVVYVHVKTGQPNHGEVAHILQLADIEHRAPSGL